MARSFSATKSKAGKAIKCGRCGVKVEPGQKYFYFSVGFRGSKQIRRQNHPPRQSELCGSKMSGAYAANEGLEDAISEATSISDIASALESAASDIEQVRDEYQDSYDNLPENFQNGDMGSEIQEKIDGLDEYAQALNDKASEVSDLEPATDSEEISTATDDDTVTEDLLQQTKDLADEALGEFSL